MSPPKDTKGEALRQHGVLHPHPAAVTDPLFRRHEFFDPRDLLQVKYEMLRRVRVEGFSVTAAAAAFGFSRPAFYQALAAYQGQGLPGLIPQRPGPRHAHKLSDPILDFVLHHQAQNPGLRSAVLAGLIRDAFGRTVHPRSLERALARRQKKGALNSAARFRRWAEPWTTRYEDLRRQVVEQGSAPVSGGWGHALVIRHGLAAWMEAWPHHEAIASESPQTATTAALPEPPLPAFLRPQVTHVLVTMILCTRPEVLS